MKFFKYCFYFFGLIIVSLVFCSETKAATTITLTQVTPVASLVNQNTPRYTFSASEAGDITYGGNCTSATTDAAAGNNTITFLALPNGVHENCTILVTNWIGNTSNLLVVSSFRVDTIAPILTQITAIPALTNDATPNYTFSSTKAGAIVFGGDCNSTSTDMAIGNKTITFSTLANGVHSNCTIRVTDPAGNVSNVLAVNGFTVDTVPPALVQIRSVITPSNNTKPSYTFSSTEAGTLTYGGDCTSASTTVTWGVKTITFSTLASGIHSNCTIRVTDGAGNMSDLLLVSSFTIDLTPPILTQVTPVPTPNNGTNLNYVFSSNEAGTMIFGGDCTSASTTVISGNNSITFLPMANGVHSNCLIRVVDVAGNVSSPLVVSSFIINSSAPMIYQTAPVASTTSSITPSYSFNSTEAGTITYGGDCSSSSTVAVSGVNTINFRALRSGVHSNCTITVTDSEFYVSNLLLVNSFTIDLVLPVLTQVTPVAAVTSNPAPSYTFSSTKSGIISYGGDCSSTSTTMVAGSKTITFSALGNGVHSNCTIRVTDVAGNASNYLAVNSFRVDSAAPSLSNALPSGTLAFGTTQTILSVTSSEPATCKYSTTPGVAYALMAKSFSTTGSTTHSVTTSGLSTSSENKYYVRCIDSQSNVNLSDFLISFSIASKVASSTIATVLAKPVNFTVSPTQDRSLKLAWKNPSDIRFFQVWLVRQQNRFAFSITDGLKVYQGKDESFTDSNLEKDTLYYYSLYSYDGKSLYSEANTISFRTGKDSGPTTVVFGQNEAELIYGHNQKVALDKKSLELYSKVFKDNKIDYDRQARYAIAYFIHNGSASTKVLGTGERTSVLLSYGRTYGTLPHSISDWQSVTSIANGRWPEKRSQSAENQAKIDFKKIYKREVNPLYSYDDRAIKIMAYGLRPSKRNLSSETFALKAFKNIYKHAPVVTNDWNIVRSIAYSGARR